MENTDYTDLQQNDNYDLMQDSMDDKDNVSVVDYKMVTFSLAGKDYAIDIMQVKEIAKTGRFTCHLFLVYTIFVVRLFLSLT